VLAQVLTGKFADGLGNIKTVPDRANFDPVPWQSMAVWMLTQMKRWGYVKGDVNYKQIAEKVFLLTDAKKAWRRPASDAAGGRVPQVQGDGQGVRPGQARGVRQELRHQQDGRARRDLAQPQGGAGVAAAVRAVPGRLARRHAAGRGGRQGPAA
jgi:hypothetical protein